MDIHFRLTRRDAWVGRRYAQDRMREQGQRLGFWSALALGMLAGLLWQMYVHPGATWVWVVFVLVFLSLAGWEVYSLRLGYYLRWLTRAEGDYVLALSTEGFSLQAPNRRVAAYAWSELAALETTPDSLVFYLRAGAAFAVPRAALGENGSQALTARARTLWAAAPENMGQALPPMPAAPESPSRQAWVNLREAARLAFLAPFHLRAFRPGYGALAIHLTAFTFM
ncbi:MAG TPA: YcxB family protein, partial [Gallionellaceae bacterium]|nr:YcxB family protein [Gallionellaceae bacterium]